MNVRVDSHQHFWSVKRHDYGWLTPALGPIYRDFVPSDLIPLLMRNGIEKTILVQAAPTEAETHYLLGIAEVTPFVAGVVGWSNFEAADCAYRIAALARNKLLVGLRPMVQDIADPKWLARQDLSSAFDALVDAGLVFDALVLPQHLGSLAVMMKRHPNLPVVIDHVAKPHLRTGISEKFWDDMENLARFPQCVCKLSGLLTEAPDGADVDVLKPVFKRLLNLFGIDRILWGSDWPVLTLAASYDDWFAMANRLATGLSSDARDALFGANAKRVYGSGRGRF